jgi:hypothetical protein
VQSKQSCKKKRKEKPSFNLSFEKFPLENKKQSIDRQQQLFQLAAFLLPRLSESVGLVQ